MSRRCSPLVALLTVTLAGGIPGVGATARAQRPLGADTISAQAVAESLAVIDHIDALLKHDGNNAALWYRRGMIAWALYDRDRIRSGVTSVDWTRIGRMADTSLRIAKSIEPENPRYVLSAGQYFLGTGLLTMRVQSAAMFGTALDISRSATDPAVHSEAALEVGRVYWRSYDAVANAGYTTTDAAEVRMLAEALSKDTVRQVHTPDPERTSKTRPYTRRTVSAARRTLDRTAQTTTGFPGEADYLRAETYIREAYNAMPTYSRAYKQLVILLGERARWAELEAIAREHLDGSPKDPWSWMTLGLATYRLGDTKAARSSFDTGIRLMNSFERDRLDHLERVLRPADTATTSGWSASERAARGTQYWMDADPLWSIEEIDARAEFLARVAYAELRWSVDELSKRGADTDRGGVFIRFGPPDRIASKDGFSDWTYDFHDLHFRFVGAPSFGTAQFADFGRAHDAIDSLPAVWDNTHLLQIDSIPIQTARFRAGGDSVEVYFAAQPPYEGIRRASDVAGGMRSDFWIVDTARMVQRRDSSRVQATRTESFSRRVPFGTFTYRLEATGTASLVAGRSVGVVNADGDSLTGFPAHGFGISDFLLATSVTPAAVPAHRWSDLSFVPLTGAIAKNAQLSLVWENYDFGDRAGESVYRVGVSIQRERSRMGRIAAQIVGAAGGNARRDASLDRVQIHFDRHVAHATVMVDDVTLSLGATPPGSYLLTLDVTDASTGRTATRTARLVIAE